MTLDVDGNFKLFFAVKQLGSMFRMSAHICVAIL